MANDFSDHQDCVALWRFEDSPGFITDSQGNNDLTNDGADQENSVIKEGAQSAKFVRANTDRMTITDANQDAGFPWRYDDGGSIVKDFSICFWLRLNSSPDINNETMYVFNKYDITGLRVFAIWVDSGLDKVAFVMGHTNGTAYQKVTFATACAINKWYHVGITYKASDKSYRIRIWDDNASAFLGNDLTGAFTNATDARDVGLTIGAREGDGNREFDGYLDELVVFNAVITTDEIDDIRNAEYPTALTSEVSDSDSVSLKGWQYYKIDSAAAHTTLVVDLTALTADGDLYVRKGAFPTTALYDDRSIAGGTTSEQCEVVNTEAATWYVGVFGYAATDFTVEATLGVANAPTGVLYGPLCGPLGGPAGN